MAGKMYVGNSSDKSKSPVKIYYGNSSDEAKKVAKIYIGNSQNKAVKVWPNNILPTAYQQVEYFGLKRDKYINTGIYLIASNPRILCTYKVMQYNNSDYSYRFKLFGSDNRATTYTPDGFTAGFYQNWNTEPTATKKDKTSFRISFGNSTQNWNTADGADYVDNNHIITTQSSMEGILLNTKYSIDFNNCSGGYSRFYLYSEDGYYSMSSHNLLGSIKTPTWTVSYNSEEPFKIYLNYGAKILYYSIKFMSQSGNYLRDFYPCYRKSDNHLGFYDYSNRVFYDTSYTISDSNAIVGPNCAEKL